MVQTTVSYSDTGVTPPVFVAGSFTKWQPVELEYSDFQTENVTKYKYAKIFDISPGDHQYKFRLGPGDWWVCDTASPRAYDAAGNENNVLTVDPTSKKTDAPIVKSGNVAAQEPIPIKAAAIPNVTDLPRHENKNEDSAKSISEQEENDHDLMQSTIQFNEQQDLAAKDFGTEAVKHTAGANGNVYKSATDEITPASRSEQDEHNLTTHVEENGFVSINKPVGVVNDPQYAEAQSDQPTAEAKSSTAAATSPKVDMSDWKSADKPQPAKSALKQPGTRRPPVYYIPPDQRPDPVSEPEPETEIPSTSLFYRLCCGSRNVVVAALVVGIPVYFSWRWVK